MLAIIDRTESAPGGRVRLEPGTIYVFSVDLARVESDSGIIDDPLTAEVRLEAMARDRLFRSHRTLAGRDCLRRIIGRCSGRDPRSLKLSRGKDGKPRLLDPDDAQRIHFNASHSGDLMVVAVSLNTPVGIDVEGVRPLDNLLSTAGYYFSNAEFEELLSVHPEDQCRAFYAGWTRKEAFVKATGEGMRRDFRSFDVTLSPSAVPRIAAIRSASSVENSHAWQMFAFEPCPGYVAAVVARGEGGRLARVD
ncbi:MAG: 4'-phosphopantetheinyl transferase superfamily protein [Rhodospirillales bacterium]|nr:4'-phosphopantetheinyl transferase superfamily protein [Rhodospirillales bacterium]